MRMTLAHRYVCAGPGTTDQPCQPGVERRPERIYLLRTDEPLLSHPLGAGDLIAPDRGCLKFPAGGISLAGSCANEPGP